MKEEIPLILNEYYRVANGDIGLLVSIKNDIFIFVNENRKSHIKTFRCNKHGICLTCESFNILNNITNEK